MSALFGSTSQGPAIPYIPPPPPMPAPSVAANAAKDAGPKSDSLMGSMDGTNSTGGLLTEASTNRKTLLGQ